MRIKRATIIAGLVVTILVLLGSVSSASAANSCGIKPSLTFDATTVQWLSYADYVNRVLTVGQYVKNTSLTADASSLTLIGASSSGGTAVASPMPIVIGSLPAGATANFTLQYNVPLEVHSFRSVVLASAEDGCGNIYAYPTPAPAVTMKIVATVRDTVNLSGADGLYVDGSYAYVASGGAGSLSIINISNPYSPSLVSSLTDPSGRLERAWGVHVSGHYAYVITGYSGSSDRLTVVDVSNPAAPFIVGSLQDFINLDGGLHIDIQGNYAYVTAPADNRMTVIDISVPQNPRLVSSIKDDTRLYQADGITVTGSYAYVVSHQIDGGTDKSYLNAINISDPAHPVMASSLNSTFFRGGDQMTIIGNYMYIPGNVDHTFSIVDISNPFAMSIVSHITSDSYIGQSCYVDALNQLAYMTSADNNRLTVVDITDVTLPHIIGSVQDSTNLASALYVIAQGRFAYVTSPQGTFSVVEVLPSG